jgi:hypothetical protein
MRWVSVLAVLILVVIIGCGGGDGGSSSSGACSTPGSTNQCSSGAICTNISGDGNQCRQLCTSQADCPANQNCNGIANTTLKSCQP